MLHPPAVRGFHPRLLVLDVFGVHIIPMGEQVARTCASQVRGICAPGAADLKNGGLRNPLRCWIFVRDAGKRPKIRKYEEWIPLPASWIRAWVREAVRVPSRCARRP
jgi:hypothetical protein